MATSSASGWMRNPFQTRRFYPTIKRSMIIFTGAARDPYATVDRSETDARDRSRKEDEDATGEEGEVNEGRAMTERRERERERDGGKTHSLWTLAVLDSSFGKRIIPWPSTAGAEKGARECKPFNGLCAGTLLRIPLAFFFLSFFRWIIATETAYTHIRACVVWKINDEIIVGEKMNRIVLEFENLFYVKRRNVFLSFF